MYLKPEQYCHKVPSEIILFYMYRLMTKVWGPTLLTHNNMHNMAIRQNSLNSLVATGHC